MTENIKIPTTVVNGFLGSGKTTVISHLVDYLLAQKKQVVFIKNEIGNEDLDTKLMRGKNIVAQELLNGCICCTLIGPFLASIDEMVETYRPDRIIIESAGSADPASLALMVENHPRLIRDGVVTIIDVLNFNGYDKIDQVSRRQAEFTDLIIFNKVELANNERKRQVVGYVRELNEKAPIIETKEGKINPDLVFGLGATDLSEFIEKEGQAEEKNSQRSHNQHHHENDDIDAFSYKSARPLDKNKLEELLKRLPKNVFRIKGVIKVASGYEVVNGVFNRIDYSELPPGMEPSGTNLIFIGYRISGNRAEIENNLRKIEIVE